LAPEEIDTVSTTADRGAVNRRSDEDLAEHLALALEAGGLGTWRWDKATGLTQWDAKIEELFGLRPGEFDGTFDAWVALLHPDDREATLRELEAATESKRSYMVQHRVVWPDGSVHWLQGKGQVTVDDDGNATGTIGCSADVTDQMLLAIERERFTHAALEAAEQERVSRERLEFLGEINEALANAVTRVDVMRNVTRAAVPRLGDWCAIFVLPDADAADAAIPDIEVAHVDSKAIAYVKQWQAHYPYDPDANVGIAAVIRSGRSEFYPDISEQLIERSDATESAREILRALALRSAMLVPLVRSGRVVGAMQFVNSRSSRPYASDDLALAEAVAHRIASTLENIRLSEHQRTIATTLQASLLPDHLPEIPNVDIAVRYWASGEGTEVGGDFYDVFEVDDHYAIVIGDVCGTGPAAASMTALARHTIRAAAWQGATSEEVLAQLNNAILRSGRATFCTALFCTLTPTASGFRFDVCAGGHPLPIIVREGAGAHSFGTPGTLLGLIPEATSHTVSTDLAANDTVVLYTDGATDVRPPHDLTTEALEILVERAATPAPDASGVADRLGSELSAILPILQRNDDIALLTLRVTKR
jgi:PAS domain S-box-containing protein